MKTETAKKTALILFIALVLGLVLSFCTPIGAHADDYCDYGNCPAESVPQVTVYDPPSAPTCDVVVMEELNVLQIRDAYHISKIDELTTDVVDAEDKVFSLERLVVKQAKEIKKLKAQLGRR